jgi:hypothetical protein
MCDWGGEVGEQVVFKHKDYALCDILKPKFYFG